MKEKLSINLEDLPDWGEFPLVTPIVIVTTISKDNVPNAAIKSWFMPATNHPPMLIFSCRMNHNTARNIMETREFVVNVPTNEIATKVRITADPYPPDVNEIEKADLTAIPSKKVKPPSIEECVAHLECTLVGHRQYGNDVLFMGKVLHASVDKEIWEASTEEKFKLLSRLMLAWSVNGNIRPYKRKDKRTRSKI
jgi:flavin reductase (DIM6/NTAB) family NADH-FMN oxidoreductase RutF